MADRMSVFYTSFPSKSATNVPIGVRSGFSEDLKMVIAVGYDQDDDDAVEVIVEPGTQKGILLWPKSTLEIIKHTTIRGATTRQQKQLHVFNYLFELVYELMLSPDDDASSNPGFEACGLKSFA